MDGVKIIDTRKKGLEVIEIKKHSRSIDGFESDEKEDRLLWFVVGFSAAMLVCIVAFGAAIYFSL